MTRCQRQVLDFLVQHIAEKGYAPSFEEIATHFEYRSNGTVSEHLRNLEQKGYIRRTYNEARSIEILQSDRVSRAVQIPVLGFIGSYDDTPENGDHTGSPRQAGNEEGILAHRPAALSLTVTMNQPWKR